MHFKIQRHFHSDISCENEKLITKKWLSANSFAHEKIFTPPYRGFTPTRNIEIWKLRGIVSETKIPTTNPYYG